MTGATSPALEGYTDAVLDDAVEEAGGRADELVRTRPADHPVSQALAAIASDLEAVDRLVRHSEELEVALTDPALPGKVRRAVLDDLIRGKVSERARRIAAYGAGAVRSQAVPGALDWSAMRARAAAESRATEVELLPHMDARLRVGGYASAVFERLSADELAEVEDELFRFARIVGSTPALRSVLGDRDVAVEARLAIVSDLLASKVLPATLRLAGYVVRGGRPRDIVGTLNWLVEQTALARGWRVARVRSGQEVDGDERAKLEETLSRLAGSPVEIQVSVDPELLAGVNVEIGDLQLDATVRGRLDRLREHLSTSSWAEPAAASTTH